MEGIMQHFRPEEQEFITQVMDWRDEVLRHYAPKLTGFLDPRQLLILKSVIGENGEVQVQLNGAFKDAERQRALLFPDYLTPTAEDFSLALYEVNYPSKFIQIKHPDVLGSLLALGLERGKFGDIRLDDKKIQFVIQREIANFVEINLEAINKAHITLSELSMTAKLLENTERWREQSDTVSSLRLDTVLAAIYKISRQKSAQLIQAGKVKVNHGQQEQISFELQEHDLISVRGLGRSTVRAIEGRTKKDKIRIVFGKLEKNQ